MSKNIWTKTGDIWTKLKRRRKNMRIIKNKRGFDASLVFRFFCDTNQSLEKPASSIRSCFSLVRA